MTPTLRPPLVLLALIAVIIAYGSVAFQYHRIAQAHRETKFWAKQFAVSKKRYRELAKELRRRKIEMPPPVITKDDD